MDPWCGVGGQATMSGSDAAREDDGRCCVGPAPSPVMESRTRVRRTRRGLARAVATVGFAALSGGLAEEGFLPPNASRLPRARAPLLPPLSMRWKEVSRVNDARRDDVTARHFPASFSSPQEEGSLSIVPYLDEAEVTPLLLARSHGSFVHVCEIISHKRPKRIPIPVPVEWHAQEGGFLPDSAWKMRRYAHGSSSPSSSSHSTDSGSGPEGWGQTAPSSQRPAASPDGDGGDEPMDADTPGDGDDGHGADDGAAVDSDEARMDLTDDLLLKVFSFLDHVTLCRAAIVCRQWRSASSHDAFWKTLNFAHRQVSHEQVVRLCRKYPKATSLNLSGAPCVDEDLVRDALRSLRGLTELQLGGGCLSDAFFYALGMDCTVLEKLEIHDSVLGSGGAQEIQLRHDSLLYLVVKKCRVLRIAIRCPQLVELDLDRTSQASAQLHCPRLVKLDVSACHKLSDAGLRMAATSCPLLAHLDISKCAFVSDDTLREISAACGNLKILNASYCPNISLEGVRMPMLVELSLMNCEGINSSSMTALSHCFMLETLKLDFCCFLTAVNLDLPRLSTINLTNTRKFAELTLRSPALTKLDLDNCPLLSRIDLTSNSVQKLNLKRQQGLSHLALNCPWLRVVDLTECEALTNSVCEIFCDGGGCPTLNSLTLDNCEGLTDVTLTSSSLRLLSLIGCRGMCSLRLGCPALQQLQLEGCDHLLSATFSPVGLVSLNLGICPHLTTLEIEASQMTNLDLKGCGDLTQAAICCPRLQSLDATYCSQLGDDCLAAAARACPEIQELVLSFWPSVGAAGLLSLRELHHLTTLDLSYTFLTDLSPVFVACPHLKVLILYACKYLSENALEALHGGRALPELRELDLSYGSLGRSAIEGVFAHCPQLMHVSLNGCSQITDFLWTQLSASPVGSTSHRTGLIPEDGMITASPIEDVGMEDASLCDEAASGFYDFSGEAESPRALLAADVMNEVPLACMEAVVEHGLASEPGIRSPGGTDGSAVYGKDSATVKSGRGGYAPNSFEFSSEDGTGRKVEELDLVSAEMKIPGSPVRLLQTLNCVGCSNIREVNLLRSSACPYLSSIDLSLTNVREVHLACSNLTSLKLSNCVQLVQLELECPRLTKLDLQACGIEPWVLESAIKACILLETLDVRNCPKISEVAAERMRAVCPGLKRLYSTKFG